MKKLFVLVLGFSLLITAITMPAQAAAAGFEQIANSAKLQPTGNGNEELDAVVKAVLEAF